MSQNPAPPPFDLIPALWGGISKQPEAMRRAGQVEDADNAYLSVANGASIRPGTTFDRAVTGLTAGKNYRLHAIDRDGEEQYLAVYGEGAIRIFELYGAEATVNYTSSANTYFTGLDADLMKLITVNDTTLVLNTTVAAAALDSSASYTVTREHADYDAMIATSPADGTYHRTLADTVAVPAGYFQYQAPDSSTPAKWVWQTGDTQAKRYWGLPNYWTQPVINPLGLAMRLRRQKIVMTGGSYDESDAAVSAKGAEAGVNTAYSNNPPTYTSTGAFAGYTWEEGDEILLKDWLTVTVQGGGTDTIDAFVRIAHKLSSDKVVLDNAKARTAETYDPDGGQSLVTLDYPHPWPTAGDLTKDAEGIYQRYEFDYDWNSNPPSTMDDITERIQTEFRSAGADNVLVSWESTGLSGKGEMTVTSGWRGEQSEIVGFYKPDTDNIRRSLNSDDPVADDTASPIPITDYNPSTISNHPFTYADGTHTAGTGTEVLTATDPLDAVWIPVEAPGVGFSKLDATTLPIQLTRTTVSTPGSSAAVFTGARIDWNVRTSGDNATNPTPDIFLNGVKIADIAIHRDRLVLGGDVYVQFSQSGDLFNFFLEDANDPNDADPIEVTLPSGFGGEVAFVDQIVPFRDSLSVFTKAGRQYDLSDPGVLSKDTAALTPSTNYRTLGVQPQADGSTMYFAALDGRNAAIYEYFYDDNRLSNRAGEISAHVPGLIPRSLQRLIAGRDGETFYVLPKNDNVVYVYRQFWQGNEKIQSAWATYTFNTGDRICDIAVLDGKVWMLIERGSAYVIEWFEEGELVQSGTWAGYDAPRFYQTAEDANVYVEQLEDTGLTTVVYQDILYTIDEGKCYARQAPASGATVFSPTGLATSINWPDPLYVGSQSIAQQSTYVWETVNGSFTYRVERGTYADLPKWIYRRTENYDPDTVTIDSIEYSVDSTATVSLTTSAWAHPTDPFQTITVNAIGLPFNNVLGSYWWEGSGTVEGSTDGPYAGASVRVERLTGQWRISANIGSGMVTVHTTSAGSTTDTTWRSTGPGSPAPGSGEASIGNVDINNNITTPVDYVKTWTKNPNGGPTGPYYLRANTQNGMTWDESELQEPATISDTSS